MYVVDALKHMNKCKSDGYDGLITEYLLNGTRLCGEKFMYLNCDPYSKGIMKKNTAAI